MSFLGHFQVKIGQDQAQGNTEKLRNWDSSKGNSLKMSSMSSVLVKRVSFFQKIGKKYQKNCKKYFSYRRRTKKGAETGIRGVFSLQCLIFSSKIHDSIQNQQWNSNIGFSEGKDSICGIRNRNRPTDLNLGRENSNVDSFTKASLGFRTTRVCKPTLNAFDSCGFPWRKQLSCLG